MAITLPLSRSQITDASGVVPTAVDVGLGLVAVEVLGLKSASTLSSIASPAWVTVTGTWGVSTPPVILNVTAADTGRQSGFTKFRDEARCGE